jgi:GTP-binding protein HflX
MHSNEKSQQTAFVIHPQTKASTNNRSLDDIIEEACGLARAIELEVIETRSITVSKIHPGYFISKGLRESIGSAVNALEPTIVVVNHALTPIQQRNLEQEWQCKVIDRTGLILEIFGARAQTKEGRIQVELAALDYQRSRLVRSWTHLERQRGGAGFMGGPGETQIELDKRMIDGRMKSLKKDLAAVSRTRTLARENRESIPFPVVSIVGYTNAGKSTLFNTLTDAGVFAEDLPFATLDTTMRRLTLPASGTEIILADTVGFISDLPTHLVASFRATLEQTAHADVLVHLIDVSRSDYREQRADVIEILKDLDIDYENDPRILEVYNKIDCLDEDAREEFERQAKTRDNLCLISAREQTDLPEFLSAIDHILTRDHACVRFEIPSTDGKAMAWLYEHGSVNLLEEEQGTAESMALEVNISKADLGKFSARFSYNPL